MNDSKSPSGTTGSSPFNPADDGEDALVETSTIARGVESVEDVDEIPDCPEAPITGHDWRGVTLWVEDRGSDETEAYERCDHCGWYRIVDNPVVFDAAEGR